MQVKHIAHVQSFFWVYHTIQSGTVACVEVRVHFDTPTQCPPISPRVIVTMIFNVSELVHMTCVFTYVQSDYAVVNMCINTLYPYIVTMILNVSELVHMTCVFTYVQSDYSVVNMCINTLYPYICALDMCYSLNVMGCSHACVYTM